jgi:CheY-like chemotaxis protein
MTLPIYPDVGDCRALIVDGNATSRSVLAAMLRDMGVGTVVQCARVAEARRALEVEAFDIVLCDYHFEHSPATGQDLLDDLRRAQLLPYSTVFIMVTGEASYARVAEAAEGALDGYLLKPHTFAMLEQRLVQARHRKKVLKSIFEAVEGGNFPLAAALCVKRFQARDEFWLFAARIGAELLLRIGRHDAAQRLYDAVRETRALPWARLGIARAELEGGRPKEAMTTLDSLMRDEPRYADAYDVMGRVQVEQGELEAALETYRRAVEITPQSIARLQKQGMLAFHLGAAGEARRALEMAMRIGLNSKMFDAQSLVMLALNYFDTRDGKELSRARDMLDTVHERRPDDRRIARFVELAGALKALHGRHVADAIDRVRRLAADAESPDFDFEAATNLLAVVMRMRTTEVRLDDTDAWIRQIARRFCVSKASAELLRLAVRADPACEALIAECHASINGMAEEAMAHSLNGAPAEAVRALMSHGAQTRNAKLIEMAGLVLNRHTQKIGDSGELAQTIASLRERFCARGTQVAVGGATGRAAGSLNLRA